MSTRRNVLIAVMMAVIFGLACPSVHAVTIPPSFYVVDSNDLGTTVSLFSSNYTFQDWTLQYSYDNSSWANMVSPLSIDVGSDQGTKLIYFHLTGSGGVIADGSVQFQSPNPSAPLYTTAIINWIIPSGGFDISVYTAQASDSVSPVPIPASVLLLGTGLLGVGILSWRRKSR